jgi:hypothetical protein
LFPVIILTGLWFFFSFRSFTLKPEGLCGISFNYEKSEVTLLVVTKGCTSNNDFTFQVKGDKLTILRTKADLCKMVPEITAFTYSLKSVGLSPDKTYTLTNKLIANPNLANLR